ncbi:MAG: AgmX/PglI C-terminal domain-containing protein [Myxococcales bacterium]|nr:AgmX/PglI C-terminal domain-containing protein [Myxococcales bacterium]
MRSTARDILLLAAEDAFEFERWRDAGPVTADVDPEIRAAEIAEFEALGIPLPDDLDSLRRELEYAPKVRDAIHSSANAMRRTGRATASALVALGPQHLMHPGARMAWGWAGGPVIDPRLGPRLGPPGMDPRMDPRLMGMAAPAPAEPEPRGRGRGRKLADAEVVAPTGAVAAEVVDGFEDDLGDDEDDDFEERERQAQRRRERDSERRAQHRREQARREQARRSRPARDWDEDDFGGADEDDDYDSLVAAPVPAPSPDRNTLLLGGLLGVAVIALLWMAFHDDDKDAPPVEQQALVQPQPAVQPDPQPPPQPAPAIDPNTGLPYGQAPAPVVDASALASAGGGRRGGGGGGRSTGARGTTTPSASGSGGGTAFGGFQDIPGPPGTNTKPAGGTAPAGGTTPAPAPADGGAAAGGEQTSPPADGGAQPPPAEEPKPAEPPKPEEPELTKSKMTPAIKSAVTNKASELYACYQDATVAKPDLAGNVKFTISLDQDGVVTKVDIAQDEVGYGVAKCAAKKIKRWTLPSAGIPIIFDLPFKFG